VSGAENKSGNKWIFGMRVIPGTVQRASLRTTLTYRLYPRLTAGIEVNPRADDSGGRFSPLLNWLVMPEGKRRPALILGTSSDRIGTPKGQSFYATLSKNLEREIKLPIAPYVGVSYGTYEHRWLPVTGLNIYFTNKLSGFVIYDGVRVHPMLTYTHGRHSFSFILAFANKPGLSYNISF
jgi:hypothetical protein